MLSAPKFYNRKYRISTAIFTTKLRYKPPKFYNRKYRNLYFNQHIIFPAIKKALIIVIDILNYIENVLIVTFGFHFVALLLHANDSHVANSSKRLDFDVKILKFRKFLLVS